MSPDPPETRDLFEGWKGQYDRMLRWENRVNDALRGDNGDEIYDFIYAFFQSCYHLKDWLITKKVATKDELENFVHSTTELQLCRDICNATKHLNYKNYSIGPKPKIGREWDSFGQRVSGFYLYLDERRPIPELMKNCIAAWDGYLAGKGLSSNSGG